MKIQDRVKNNPAGYDQVSAIQGDVTEIEAWK